MLPTQSISKTTSLTPPFSEGIAKDDSEQKIINGARYHYSKRTFGEIRDLIFSKLQKRPSTLYEIMRSCNISRYTALRHLEWLQSLSVVRRTEQKYKGKTVVLYDVIRH